MDMENKYAENSSENYLESDEKPRKRKKWDFFREYCENSSVHGMRYLGEPNRPVLERIWWIITFVVSISVCGMFILSIWRKWENNPVIVSFSDKSTPIWKIPFPAITVCSDSKFHREQLDLMDVLTNTRNYTEDEMGTMSALVMVCDRVYSEYGWDDAPKTMNVSVINNLNRMTTRLQNVLVECEWENQRRDCLLFSKIITEEGICFTSNMLSQAEMFRTESIQDEYPYIYHNKSSTGWNLEHGYPANQTESAYPYRSFGAGSNYQLQIYFCARRDDLDYLCQLGNQGYKVLLHHPADFPRIRQQFFRLPLDWEGVVNVKPNVMTISDRLRPYDARRRQCYFPSERHLQFFRIYTQGNCEIECVANYTLKRCGCVMFSMPRNNSTPICGPGSLRCKWAAQDELIRQDIDLNAGSESSCDCLPACTSIQYEVELSQSPFNLAPLGAIFTELNTTLNALSRLSVFFREPQIITSQRAELYGPTDFIANCGGLLGLFMGVSILSFIEIIYFVTLRLFYTLKMRLNTFREDGDAGIRKLLGKDEKGKVRVSKSKKMISSLLNYLKI